MLWDDEGKILENDKMADGRVDTLYMMRQSKNAVCKEIGLNMFWLAKFRPFNIDGKGFDERFCFDINEEFILHYMFIALEKLAKIQKKNYDSGRITRSLYDELLYSMSFRDISKEAMGIIVELVANIIIYE